MLYSKQVLLFYFILFLLLLCFLFLLFFFFSPPFKVWSFGVGCGFGGYSGNWFFQLLKRAPPWELFVVAGKFGDFTTGPVIKHFRR